ncbi:tryptophan synthase subunit alpha [Brachybacterium endophyticum]|uniref:Tryptophan synthase alpha chain n=1 Tax=Brachybacterium endophyticum TaxID=2182385 RepID=A0A2U2RIW9_9MICO|nr:tryptophan synthase subunit alpha [Brachybacterium endophyticum]PWH05791.1 tryptophan synthase subunit alpha [Brachybacterium endophyticum]
MSAAHDTAGSRLRAGDALERARAEGRAALVGYLPVGYPDQERFVAAARTLVDNGVDILELGLPYSDPVMDGPVIQEAATAALAAGTRTHHVLEAVDALRGSGAAVLVMTYWNPVLAQGVDSFARRLADAGGAGLITPDLIPDEAEEWIASSEREGLDRVFLVAPSSPRERLEHVVRHASGFVYAASTMGVTGTRASVSGTTAGLVERTRAAGARNVCVGLGVSTGDQAAEVGAYADGVIVGSAFVKALKTDFEAGDESLSTLARTARDLRAGVERSRTSLPASDSAAHGMRP